MRHALVCILTLLLLTNILPATAGNTAQEMIEIGQAWARATTPDAKVAGAYMTFTNSGTEPDTLTKAETPVAATVMLHETTEQNGIASMHMLDSLPLAPGKLVALQPGGKHFMLMGLTRHLKQGDSFPMTLYFAKAGKTEIQVTVHAPGAKPPPH